MNGRSRLGLRLVIRTIVLVGLLLGSATAAGAQPRRSPVGVSGLEAHQPAARGAVSTTVTLDPVADATVDATADPAIALGVLPSLHVFYGGPGEEARALIRFNLSAAVPPAAVLDSAHLELYLREAGGATPVELTAAMLTQDWIESQVRWGTQPASGPPTVTVAVDATAGYKSLDITDIAQAWRTVPNYGLVLSSTSAEYERRFGSREYLDAPPRLVISYHMPVLELQAVADTTVDSAVATSGAETTLEVGWNVAPEERTRRALLRFPALELPADAWIVEASLELTTLDGQGGTVARVTEPWGEDTVHWDDQPGYAPPVAEPVEPGRWDVTELVNGWHLGIHPDYGLALLEAAGTAASASYSSSEGAAPPRLIISYVLGVGDWEDLMPGPPPGLGAPSFEVNPTLEPFDEALAPIVTDDGDRISRPLAVLQAEHDEPFTFVADEVVYTPESPEALGAFLEAYGGRIVRAPGLPEPPPGWDGETRDIAPDPSYLIQVNTTGMSLVNLEADAADVGLVGEMQLSSEAGLRLLALVLHERNAGADIGLDGAGQFVAYPSFPPLTLREEPTVTGFEDPINEAWRYPEIGDTTVQQTGVNRAWQYLAFADRSAGGVELAVIDGGFCLDSTGGRCTDASGQLNVDIPANFAQYDFDGDDYNASGTNPTSCTGGSPCPYHGSDTLSIATAAQNNSYGIAGVGSPVARPMLFKLDVGLRQGARAIRTATKWGAKIVSMSWTIDCGWWCRTFSGISGYGKLKDALRDAESADVLTVAAAGNDNKNLRDINRVPCKLRWNSFCVGALASNSRDRASFSNFGTVSATPLGTGGVNIWAPGAGVRVGPNLAETTNHTTSGTSIATPFVAGAAALAWGVDPTLTRAHMRSLILNTRNAPLNSTVAPGSVNVMRLAMAAGPPLQDRLGLIGHADAAALITDAGLTDLTITPGEEDYFEYQAEDYLASAEFIATYVEPLGDLVMGADKPAMMASHTKAPGALATAYTVASNDLCIGDQYGEQFVFYVRGVNPAVGNAYRLAVQTTPATSLASDDNEPNDTAIMATKIAAPRMSPMDLFTAERIDCRDGLTLDSVSDTDFYSMTVAAADLSTAEHYTALCVDIHADFPITATLTQGGTVLETDYAEDIWLEHDGVQAGSALLQVWGPDLNAYTLRTRVCSPGGNERAWDLENWLKNATLPEPPDLLPRPGGHVPLPDWLRAFPWDVDTLFALEANGVLPVARTVEGLGLSLTGQPRVFALGSPMGGEMTVDLGPGLPVQGAAPSEAAAAQLEAGGVHALLQDFEGNELWRVEGVMEDTTLTTEIEGGTTYLLLVNGEPEVDAHLSVRLPDQRIYLPTVLR